LIVEVDGVEVAGVRFAARSIDRIASSAAMMGCARSAVMLSNLLCVAGALALGFAPMAAVLLSSFGTSVAYGAAKRALRRTPYRAQILPGTWKAGRHRSGSREGVCMKKGSSDADDALRIAQLPKEAGWALIAAGIVGLAVPGVLGAPFLLAGAAVLAPGGSKLLARWAPRSAARQLGRFLDDLERRFPRR
jgi:hypothetical protein